MAKEVEIDSGEGELISQICAGRKDLFCNLIQPYQRKVFALAHSLLRNAADAEEVAQEVFMKVYSGLPNFRREAKFSTWLIQIALNESRKRLRRNPTEFRQAGQLNSADEPGDYMPSDLADWREIPSDALARKELRQTIERALESLLPIYREVLVLRDLQLMSIAETSEALEISPDVVKTRLRRARLQMRDALAPGYDGSWTSLFKESKSVRPW